MAFPASLLPLSYHICCCSIRDLLLVFGVVVPLLASTAGLVISIFSAIFNKYRIATFISGFALMMLAIVLFTLLQLYLAVVLVTIFLIATTTTIFLLLG